LDQNICRIKQNVGKNGKTILHKCSFKRENKKIYIAISQDGDMAA
jgi:hypothetical protein